MRRYITRGCPRCRGVGYVLPQLIAGKWHGGSKGPCFRCRGEGVVRYILLGRHT